MLCLSPIIGGLLIMMGQHDRSEALYYYFRPEDQVRKPSAAVLQINSDRFSPAPWTFRRSSSIIQDTKRGL
jgi:hypothetical protein